MKSLKKSGVNMELKRDIYKELMKWKNRNSGKVLELKGARQTGKTFILDKFARENYQRFFYINMAQSTGEDFLMCLAQATAWTPGEPRIKKPLHNALKLFDSAFVDDTDTVVVIDEIQESAKVFSLIRQFSREFTCHFIVTGSYLGKTLQKGYFLPAGDTEDLVMDTLSFEEFLDALGKRELYETIDLFGAGSHEDYDELKSYYDIYCEIGGYPAVVARYLETGDIAEGKKVIPQVIRIFVEESTRYFENILETNLFEKLFPAIAKISIREKKGCDNLIKELSQIIFKEDSNKTTKTSINYATAWLYRSDIIGFCGKAVECDPTDTRADERFYFRDLGVARYFLDMAGAEEMSIAGYINENFVYIDLLKRARKMDIAGFAPMFGTYKSGEIDFVVNSRSNYKTYGVEVKAGKSSGRTAQQLLKDGRVEAVYFLKGDTYGGVAERMVTVPIYLVGRLKFDYLVKKV